MKKKRTLPTVDPPEQAGEPVVVASAPAVEAEVVTEPLNMIDNSGKAPAKCSVCGDPCAPNSNEGLCWVCRRLKISAWRDNDMQAAVQE